MLLWIWLLSSNSFLFPRQTSEEQTAATTTANSTSFRAVAIKSIVMSFTNTRTHTLTSIFSKSNRAPFTNTHMQKLTSDSFNAPATTFVSNLPQTLLPYFTVTNASDTRSEKIFSAHNIPSNKVSRLIHGAIHTSNSSTPTSVVS
jgi:hypothetical protein